ncbi:MAG: hypothetical protein LWW85_14905 [Marinilabiliales bacterium]|nr:hypothetical protein [Marinilabiliales bacterium]
MAEKTAKTKEVTIAVVMESDPKEKEKMVKIASYNEQIDFVLQSDNPEKFYAYAANLKKRGIRVKGMLLMGHGSTTYFYERWWNYLSGKSKIDEKLRHKIGNFGYKDLDYNGLIKDHQRNQKRLKEIRSDLSQCNEALGKAKTDAEKKRLMDDKKDFMEQMDRYKEMITVQENRLKLFDDVSDSMAPGARIGLFNCYGAEDTSFFNNVADLFLHKHGGEICGTDGLFITIKTHPLVEWVFGTFSTDVTTTGNWQQKTVTPATHCNGHNHKPGCTCGWGGPR